MQLHLILYSFRILEFLLKFYVSTVNLLTKILKQNSWEVNGGVRCRYFFRRSKLVSPRLLKLLIILRPLTSRPFLSSGSSLEAAQRARGWKDTPCTAAEYKWQQHRVSTTTSRAFTVENERRKLPRSLQPLNVCGSPKEGGRRIEVGLPGTRRLAATGCFARQSKASWLKLKIGRKLMEKARSRKRQIFAWQATRQEFPRSSSRFARNPPSSRRPSSITGKWGLGRAFKSLPSGKLEFPEQEVGDAIETWWQSWMPSGCARAFCLSFFGTTTRSNNVDVCLPCRCGQERCHWAVSLQLQR